MKSLWIVAALLLSSPAWAQNPPPKGPDLTAQGFSESEAKAIQADLKTWETTNRDIEADLQILEAQRTKVLLKDIPDRGELEKLIRSQSDLQIKRELARIDLVIQWRTTYGVEKSRGPEGMLRGPQGAPNGPQGMQPGNQPRPNAPAARP